MWFLAFLRNYGRELTALGLTIGSVLLPLIPTGSAKVTAQTVVRVDKTGSYIPGNATNGIEDLKKIYQIINTYRVRHNSYPDILALLRDLGEGAQAYGFADYAEALTFLTNPDSRYSDSPTAREKPDNTTVYILLNVRPDGSPIGGPKAANTRDVLAYTNIYYYMNLVEAGGPGSPTGQNPAGFYLVLWDDGQVTKIAYDQVVYLKADQGHPLAFPGQAGVPANCLTYDEYWTKRMRSKVVPRGKPRPQGETNSKPDNQAIEALVSLTRLLDLSVDREQVWSALEVGRNDKTEYSLQEVLAGAAKLDVRLQSVQLTLSEIKQRGGVAILQLQNPNQIVTLSAIGPSQALIYVHGSPFIVDVAALSAQYSGSALVLADSIGAQSKLLVDASVHSVQTTGAQQEITGHIPITNRSQEKVELKIDPNVCGCTKADLSTLTLAPGETSTLTATIGSQGWGNRNVIVTINTTDPLQPKLQLGFFLSAPGPR